MTGTEILVTFILMYIGYALGIVFGYLMFHKKETKP